LPAVPIPIYNMLGLFHASSTTCCGSVVENELARGNPVDTWWISSFRAFKTRLRVWKRAASGLDKAGHNQDKSGQGVQP
jgi:hypothetical protein